MKMENALNPIPQNRLTVKEMKQEVLSHFYFEKGILFTICEMIRNPARLISIYLYEDRKRAFNPFRYLLIGVAVSTIILINHPGFKDFLAGLQEGNMGKFTSLEDTFHIPFWDLFMEAQTLYLTYQNVLIVLSIPVVSWVSLKFFNSKNFNFAEHMAINAFVFGTTYWISSFFGISTYFFSEGSLITYSITFLTFVLSTYMYLKIFKVGILKAFFGFILAYIPIYIIGIAAQLIIFAALIYLEN